FEFDHTQREEAKLVPEALPPKAEGGRRQSRRDRTGKVEWAPSATRCSFAHQLPAHRTLIPNGTNGLVQLDVMDAPPRTLQPRKSSLKPPSPAFPMQDNKEVVPDASKIRRKSIVTFNETTEIRS